MKLWSKSVGFGLFYVCVYHITIRPICRPILYCMLQCLFRTPLLSIISTNQLHSIAWYYWSATVLQAPGLQTGKVCTSTTSNSDFTLWYNCHLAAVWIQIKLWPRGLYFLDVLICFTVLLLLFSCITTDKNVSQC